MKQFTFFVVTLSIAALAQATDLQLYCQFSSGEAELASQKIIIQVSAKTAEILPSPTKDDYSDGVYNYNSPVQKDGKTFLLFEGYREDGFVQVYIEQSLSNTNTSGIVKIHQIAEGTMDGVFTCTH